MEKQTSQTTRLRNFNKRS